MNLSILKEQFKNHVYKFDMNDKAINRKYYHSLRVMEISNQIATYEKLDEKYIEIANIIGLLHDYARFPQWAKYKTYNDIKSIDHGDLAVELLFKQNEIENFDISKDYYDEIYEAIKYHNKINIPDSISKHNTLLCKLIRDADKIDIFYILGEKKDWFLEDKTNISEEIKKEFYKNKQIDRNLVKSKNDEIILKIAMIFDLNFTYSYKLIHERKLMEKMYDNLENKEIFKEYFNYIYKYIEERID